MSLFVLICARATVRLPAVLSSNMVLQQQSEVKFWGWSEPEERFVVTTSWDHRVDSVKGNRDGKWQILLHTPAAGGPYTIAITGANPIVLENVLIGEVWVCSGQSNMEMCETWGLPDVKSELPSCANTNIRFFQVPRSTAVYPQENGVAQWAACDSNTLKRFSAVGYFFGKKLNKELNVPIGLIQAAWGGTPAEVWTPAELVNGDTALKHTAERQKPRDGWPYLPGYCYNAMLAPLTSFSIAGALWYQGESNTEAPVNYSRLLTTLIGSWRKAWNKPLSFYYVQIAPYTYDVKDQGSLLREQEAKCMQLENTGMVVISDITGDTKDIHPKNKHDVGLRLANWALAETYHKKDIVYRNPTYQQMELQGDKVVLSFADVAGGLVVKELAGKGEEGRERPGKDGEQHGKGAERRGKSAERDVKELLIAGEDRVFYPARAAVEGNRVTVSAKEVTKPVAVRYQFSNAGIGNLFNKEGLPVAPFRTDDWPVGLN